MPVLLDNREAVLIRVEQDLQRPGTDCHWEAIDRRPTSRDISQCADSAP
jgi:hypothetical protein